MNKIGILDPEGKNLNPLTGNPYSEHYRKIALEGEIGKPPWTKFPVYQDAEKIIKLIKDNQVLLIKSGTGSGKTVLVPKFALHALDYKGKVVITIPKKLPVEMGAKFAAETLDVKLGQEVGYQYRGSKLDDGSRSKTEKTKLLFSTDGSVVAQLINDAQLKAYDIVIVDEAHERKIQIDFLLLLMKKALKLNKDLKLIIMSATINPEIFANYFKKDFKYAELEVSGVTNFPIEIHYLQTPLKNPEKDFIDAGVNIIINILKSDIPGDILFFVNSLDEAKRACKSLHINVQKENLKKVFCVELASNISKEAEKYATDPVLYKNRANGPFDRKVIMATNAVESSSTIQGLIFVIDSGWAYEDSYDPNKMERKLLLERISQAQADQRKGRVGRTQNGICYRLYTLEEFNNFKKYPLTDIQKSDLTGDILRFMKLPYIQSNKDLINLLQELIEPPQPDYVKSAIYRLYAIGALDKLDQTGKLTKYGLQMVQFRKLDPILSRAVIESYKYNNVYETIEMAILVQRSDGRLNSFLIDYKPSPEAYSDRKKQEKEKGEYKKIIKKFLNSNGDFFTLVKIYKTFREYVNKHTEYEIIKWCDKNYLNYKTLKNINKIINDTIEEANEIIKKETKMNNEYIYNRNENMMGGSNNIMKNFIHGLYINLAIKAREEYYNCFPFENTTAPISRESSVSKGNKYIIYWDLVNILGRRKFNLVNKISENDLNILDKKSKELIKKCLKK